jgi:hypothetical protein
MILLEIPNICRFKKFTIYHQNKSRFTMTYEIKFYFGSSSSSLNHLNVLISFRIFPHINFLLIQLAKPLHLFISMLFQSAEMTQRTSNKSSWKISLLFRILFVVKKSRNQNQYWSSLMNGEQKKNYWIRWKNDLLAHLRTSSQISIIKTFYFLPCKKVPW